MNDYTIIIYRVINQHTCWLTHITESHG